MAARLVRSLSRARLTVLGELGQRVGEVAVVAVSVIVFGSFAREEAEATSDLDVVFVRPADVGEDDDRWATSLEQWRQFARRVTGNRVEILEAEETSIGRLLRSRQPVWADIARDGVVVYGASLDDLRDRRSD